MENRGGLTKILAAAGTALVWIPILAPVIFSAAFLIRTRFFRFDYLMPAELFPLALVGGVLLLWAALRAHSHRKLIAWGLGIAVALLIGGQALAALTGLASGAIEPAGVWWVLVLATLAGYALALVVIGAGGFSLLRELFKASRPAV